MHAVAPRPLSDSAAGKPVSVKLVRAYEAWEGNNKFLFKGRFIIGPDWRSVPITIFLIVAPIVVFCVFVARKLMDDFPHHLGILIMVSTVIFTLYDLVLLLMISVRDPGIVPRSAHAPEPEYYVDPETGSRLAGRFARFKEVVVDGTVVKSKYCETCFHYRPPRCSHCSICDNCIERFDHHCPWVGQCIGKRNYRFFFMFVSSSTLLCIYVFSFCWVYIIRIMHSERTSVWKAMIRTPASMVLIIYAFLAFWFVGGLTVFHLYLIFTNQTTYESYRNRKANGNVPRPHPYNRGIRHNLKEVFCSAIPPSGNNFRAMVVKEPEISLQGGVGGRFSSSDSGKALSDVENKNRVLLEDLALINGDDVENQATNGGSSPEKDIEPAAVDMRIDLPSEEVAELDQDTQPSWKSSWRKRSGNEDVPSVNLDAPDLVSDPPIRKCEELVRDIPSDASLAPYLSENLPTEEGLEVVGDDSSDPSRRSVEEVDNLSEAVGAASEDGSSFRFTKQQVVADSSSLKV